MTINQTQRALDRYERIVRDLDQACADMPMPPLERDLRVTGELLPSHLR